jgi:type II secretory pathway component PulF
MALAIAVFTFVCVVLVGSFKVIFMDFGLPIPLLTRIMIQISNAMTMAWLPVLEVLASVLAIWLVVNAVAGAPIRRSLACRVPLIGPIWRWTSLSEFCHLLGLLLEAELALPEALPMAADGVQDADVRAACRVIANEVASGESLARSFQGRSVFPQGLGRILSWAEGHRSLPEALHMAGEMFEARARAQANFAGTVLAVLSVIIIIAGIGVVIPAVMLPMINLISKLSG